LQRYDILFTPPTNPCILFGAVDKLCLAVVAVLQCCSSKNRLYESQKLTLYLYINIEVFLGGWEKPFKNCNTATVQQIRHPSKKNALLFVHRNVGVVPLQHD